MPRVTDAEVKSLIDTQRDTSPFIDTASLVVTESIAPKGLSDDRLRQIELYLAAHFTTLAEERGGLAMSRTGDSEERYAVGDLGRGFNMTRFGQQALALDSSGALASLSTSAGKLKALFKVV